MKSNKQMKHSNAFTSPYSDNKNVTQKKKKKGAG